MLSTPLTAETILFDFEKCLSWLRGLDAGFALLRCGVLGASSCARPRSTAPELLCNLFLVPRLQAMQKPAIAGGPLHGSP
jgi:hypothetical protein